MDAMTSQFLLNIMIGILSGPVAFFSFKRLILLMTPLSVTVIVAIYLNGDDPMLGMFDKFSFVKTDVNCSFNMSAFVWAVSAILPLDFSVLILRSLVSCS